MQAEVFQWVGDMLGAAGQSEWAALYTQGTTYKFKEDRTPRRSERGP